MMIESGGEIGMVSKKIKSVAISDNQTGKIDLTAEYVVKKPLERISPWLWIIYPVGMVAMSIVWGGVMQVLLAKQIA